MKWSSGSMRQLKSDTWKSFTFAGWPRYCQKPLCSAKSASRHQTSLACRKVFVHAPFRPDLQDAAAAASVGLMHAR